MKCFLFSAAILLLGDTMLFSQVTDALGTYTPYSLFGLGQIAYEGSAYNISMGGTGIGVRDNRFINYVNPAAVTARDSLSFMLDFTVSQKNMYNTDGNRRSAYNVFNMNNVVLTTPIWRNASAFVVGIQPFSNVGYKFQGAEYDDDLEVQAGDIKYQKYGTGSIYQLFFGGGATFFKRLSIGAQAIYYFGYIDRKSNVYFNSSPSYNTILTGWEYKVHCFSGKFGIQYAQPLRKIKSELILGATYRLGNDMRGDVSRYAFSSSTSTGAIDTVLYRKNTDAPIKISDEFGVGISFKRNDRWQLSFDYIQQNWQNSVFAGGASPDVKAVTARYYKAGFEFTPGKYDIRYYMRRVTYRGGAYYEQSYLQLKGHQINSYGITIGATFPILKFYNGVTVAITGGQRGTLKNGLVRETFINFSVGINLHDIWFMKYKYE